MELLSLKGLSKVYTGASGVVIGLNNVSLSFSEGEFVAITGESGSGKSTLAHVLGGILPYESGELSVMGKPTSHFDRADWEDYRRESVSFISQSYGILAGNTVSENVESALRLSGISKEDAKKRAEEILALVELSGFEHRLAGKLSSGQKQRLSIARALAKPSRILIADEPTGNLDKENSDTVLRLLARAARDRLVILITHEFEEAKPYVTRRIILSDGSVVTDSKIRPEYPTEKRESNAKKKQDRTLPFYIAALTLKSRPVFTSLLTLFLVFSMIVSFIFIGSFIVSLDDAPTKKYNTRYFANGDPERLVVMKPDKSEFTDDEIERILKLSRVDRVDESSYFNDICYHYVPNEDFYYYGGFPGGIKPDSDSLIYSDNKIFVRSDKYMQSLPVTGDELITEGVAARGCYEIVSADPSHSVGDRVHVYLRNDSDWSTGSYLDICFTVVGKTSYGSGLYFSDELARSFATAEYALGRIFLPYDREAIEIYYDYQIDELPPEAKEAFVHRKQTSKDGYFMYKTYAGDFVMYERIGTHGLNLSQAVVVSYEDYKELTMSYSDQISVFIDDYAYTDKVSERLNDLGYSVVSPFKIGSEKTDPTLARERITTLIVSLAASVLVYFLGILIVKAMFNSQATHYSLLSNIGLGAKCATQSIAIQMLYLTASSMILGMLGILLLNRLGIEAIANIFKYLAGSDITLLMLSFAVFTLIALFFVTRSIRHKVFAFDKKREDINFREMEASEI